MKIYLIIGLILLFLSVVILAVTSVTEKTTAYIKALFVWISLMFGIMFLTFYYEEQPIESDKPFIIETEIKVEILNGNEISRDTTYILIRPNATITGSEHKLKSK